MKEYLNKLTKEQLIEFNQNKSLIDFCQRFWSSLDDIENISEETYEVIAELLWNNLFNIISPFFQVIINHDRFNKVDKRVKWKYISEHDFECTVEYIEFEKTKYEKYNKNKEETLKEAKNLFNKIIKEKYFK